MPNRAISGANERLFVICYSRTARELNRRQRVRSPQPRGAAVGVTQGRPLQQERRRLLEEHRHLKTATHHLQQPTPGAKRATPHESIHETARVAHRYQRLGSVDGYSNQQLRELRPLNMYTKITQARLRAIDGNDVSGGIRLYHHQPTSETLFGDKGGGHSQQL